MAGTWCASPASALHCWALIARMKPRQPDALPISASGLRSATNPTGGRGWPFETISSWKSIQKRLSAALARALGMPEPQLFLTALDRVGSVFEVYASTMADDAVVSVVVDDNLSLPDLFLATFRDPARDVSRILEAAGVREAPGDD